MKPEENGIFSCAAKESWAQTSKKVEQMHSTMEDWKRYLPHIMKLDELSQIRSSNEDIRDKLLNSATGIGRVEIKVIMPIFYALCFMLVAIVVWFTGIEPSLPHRGTGYLEKGNQ